MAADLAQLDPVFDEAGREWNVDPQLLKAVALQESRGNPNAVSPARAQGLMQIMPKTQRELGVADASDPVQSIWGAAKYLSQGLDKEGNAAGALLYYHGGPDWRQSYRRESAGYVPGVTAHYRALTSAAADTGTATDATPGPAPGAAKVTDDEFLQSIGAAAPGGPNVTASKPKVAGTMSDDDFLQSIGASTGTPKPEQDASQPQQTAVGVGGGPAESALDTARRLLHIGGTPPPSSPLADAVTSPDAANADVPGGGADRSVQPQPGAVAATRPAWQAAADRLPTHALSLGTRDVIEGALGLPLMAADAASAPLRWLGMPGAKPSEVVRNALSAAGLPQSQTPGEQGRSAVIQGAASVLPTLGAGAIPALTPKLAAALSAAPAAQAVGGAAAGGAQEAARQAGYGPLVQIGAGLVGGVAGAGLVHPLMPHEPIPTITVTGELPSAPLAGVNPVSPEAAARAAEIPKAPSSPLPPEAQAAAAAAPAEHQQWVAGVPQRVADLVAENAKEGGPSALGAQATPEELAKMSPQQEKAYRRMAELNELLTPARGPDDATHVAGSIPTLAERAADPVVSQREVLAREKDPNSFEPRLEANNQARVNQFDDLSGTAVSKQDLKDQMEALDSKNAARIRSALTGDMDVQPAIAHLSDILDDPVQSERDAIQKVFAPLRSALYDQRTGEPKTDPQSIWGQFKNVQDKLKKAAAGNSTETEVMGELVGYRKQLASMLNDNTRGVFQSALDDHAALAKQFSAQDLLQKKRATLTDKNGMINANSYHRWLIDLAMRRGKPGIDASMDLPDSTMRGLIAIDNDLKRAGNIDLGKARGSPTNLYMTLGRALGIGAAHAATTAVTGHVGIGNMLAQQAVSRGEQQLQQFRLRRIVRQHLAPPPNSLQP